MTQKFKEAIKEYYEKHNLSSAQLLQMQNIQRNLWGERGLIIVLAGDDK